MSEQKDTQCRKWNLTINNPVEHGMTHDDIKKKLEEFTLLTYYCMADEKGLEDETHHTHLYIHFESNKRFSAIKKAFPPAHIEAAKGTAEHNRDYIDKRGKWEHDDKHGTKLDGTFEEWGECPIERQGKRTDLINIIEGVEAGKTNCEIVRENPKAFGFQKHMNDYRQDILYEKHRDTYRKMDVEYIYGATRIGKTKSIYDEHGYCKVYSIDDYEHPWDEYDSETVVVFDEYRSQLRISDMLKWLDGHPCKLRCRFKNKIACYTKVYIVSNEPLYEQYIHVQREQPETWVAFLARINRLYEFTAYGKNELLMLGLGGNEKFQEAPDNGTLPFTDDWSLFDEED